MNNHNFENVEDNLSLAEVINLFKKYWKSIAVGGLIGGLLGSAVATIIPPKYQATANIQVGKVANVDIESPSVLVEKIKLPMYYSLNTYGECNVADLIEPGVALAKSLNPMVAKNAPIITISYKEKDISRAKKCLESVLGDIRENQREISKPILDSKRNQLDNLRQKLESAEDVIKTLASNKRNFDFSDSKFSASTLLLATSLNKDNEIKDLRTQINEMEIALAEPQTKEAFLIKQIYAPNVRVEPKKTLIVLLASIIGCILAMGLFFLKGKFPQSN